MRGDGDRLAVPRLDLRPDAGLPVGPAGQLREHHRDRGRGRVVGGEQHEAEMVDDLTGGQQRVAVVAGVGEPGEQIRRLVPSTALGNQLVQEAVQPGAGTLAPGPPAPGKRDPRRSYRGRHHGDERVVDRARLRTQGGADKDLGGDVEGHRLDRGIGIDPPVGQPRDMAIDDGVDALGVAVESDPAKRVRHHEPMPVMVLEVPQHQAAAEHRSDAGGPTTL